jgi:hypothetical protein
VFFGQLVAEGGVLAEVGGFAFGRLEGHAVEPDAGLVAAGAEGQLDGMRALGPVAGDLEVALVPRDGLAVV